MHEGTATVRNTRRRWRRSVDNIFVAACDLSNASCSSYLLTAAWCLRAHFSTFISVASCCFAATSSKYDSSSQLVTLL